MNRRIVGKHSGFTLIELLVVIAIIAILAAILFPVFAKAKESGNKAACLNNMKQLGNGFRMYLDDWAGRFPGGGGCGDGLGGQWIAFVNAKTGALLNAATVTGDASASPSYVMSPEYGSLFKYVKNAKVYMCPSDAFGKKRKFGLSYSMNRNIAPIHNASARAIESTIISPSKTIVLIDEGAGTASPGKKAAPIVDGYFGAPTVRGGPSQDIPQDVHNGGCNFSFADGHAVWVTHKAYTSLQWVTK